MFLRSYAHAHATSPVHESERPKSAATQQPLVLRVEGWFVLGSQKVRFYFEKRGVFLNGDTGTPQNG